MADSNSTASERVTAFGKIQTTAIDELFNIRALALAGEAMANYRVCNGNGKCVNMALTK